MQPAAITNINVSTNKAPVSLVLLAAGIGRRFGGLKQLEPVGPGGETILEYTIHDAIRAGVGRVVLVVRPETEAEFRRSVGQRIERVVEVFYVHQHLDHSPSNTTGSSHRRKPWGTAHAILCAAETVKGPFVVANADDFYGAGAIAAAVNFLKLDAGSDAGEHALVAYTLGDTLPVAGRVSRAVCESRDGQLIDLVEMPEVWREEKGIAAQDRSGQRYSLRGDEWVSMNLWAFRSGLNAPLREAFDRFVHNHTDSPDAEFQIPVVIREFVQAGLARVRVIPWTGPWCGVTHRDDLDAIRTQLRGLTDAGTYTCPLFPDRNDGPISRVPSIARQFDINGELIAIAPLHGGHIHDSFIASFQSQDGPAQVVIQRINTSIFTDVDGLMGNVTRVCNHLQLKVGERHPADADRRALAYVPTRSGSIYHRASDGSCWRVCRFIEKSTSVEFSRTPADAEMAGRAFGEFHAMLADLPPPALRETIPHFHDTPHRFAALLRAVADDSHGRAEEVAAEIEFSHSRQALCGALIEPLQRGELPMRIAHHDAKLSNVLLDSESGEPLCVVDLDTVMPGTVLYDFGDMMRTMLCAIAEDERDLSKVCIDPGMFQGLACGYLVATRNLLTPGERELLVTAGLVITYEQGIRFLTDYLQGDSYYRSSRRGQNRDRCRVQFALLRQFEQSRIQMESMVT